MSQGQMGIGALAALLDRAVAAIKAAPKRVPAKRATIQKDALGRLLPEPSLPRASRGTTLALGRQWVAHDRSHGKAAQRRLKQRFARGVAVCGSCETEHHLEDIRVFKTDPTGALLLMPDFEFGTGVRVLCTGCVDGVLRAAEDAPASEETA